MPTGMVGIGRMACVLTWWVRRPRSRFAAVRPCLASSNHPADTGRFLLLRYQFGDALVHRWLPGPRLRSCVALRLVAPGSGHAALVRFAGSARWVASTE